MERFTRTVLVMFFAVFPPVIETRHNTDSSLPPSCEPRDLGSLHRFLDSRGHFRVLFGNCLPVAAPFILFRLKRQGYSRCTVRVCAGGLLVEGDR